MTKGARKSYGVMNLKQNGEYQKLLMLFIPLKLPSNKDGKFKMLHKTADCIRACMCWFCVCVFLWLCVSVCVCTKRSKSLHTKFYNSIIFAWVPLFSCDQAALQMVFSVCPSVRLSVCHTFLTMFPSSYHHEIFWSYYQ